MDGLGTGLIAVALWVAALLAIAVVIRSSLRRDNRPRTSKSLPADTTAPNENNEDLSYAEAGEFQDLGGRELVGALPKSRVARRTVEAPRTPNPSPRSRPPAGGRSLDAQIEALAAGTDDDLTRLIQTVQASRPASTRKRQPSRPSTEPSSGRAATQTSSPTSDSDDDGSRSTGGISYIVVDEEGRPELN